MRKQLNLNSKLTLQQFIDLFNSDDENELWDLIYLKATDENGNEIDFDEIKILLRLYYEIQ